MPPASIQRLVPASDRALQAKKAARRPPTLPANDVAALEAATHGDPFAILGPHGEGERYVRAYLPGARSVDVCARCDGSLLVRLGEDQTAGLYSGYIGTTEAYFFRVEWPGATHEAEDPYSFGICLSDQELRLASVGAHPCLHRLLGAHCVELDGVEGVRFAVWAPNARRVAVIGDFNTWDERRHPMRQRHEFGVWELFVPRLCPGEKYKYAIVGPDGERLPDKADPFAFKTEVPPATASIVTGPPDFDWSDASWIATRGERHSAGAPISIYEVHIGSWLRVNNREPDWRQARERLLPYVKMLGFTHIELLPVAGHPFAGSWGYQPLSLFAPDARRGDAREFAAFVDACHRQGVGVIVDWTPAHFPDDAHGLARFDGTALYEHEDPREGHHPDWRTLIYNFGRREVSGFLIASALRWFEDFHIDGLRVDAVASMLYRDYSRRDGEWIPNAHGGRENLEAIEFLRRVNATVASRFPGVMMIAEESTAWPGVTAPIEQGGLGFSYKWNMGWMNDTLRYARRDPIHRRWHHDEITFGLCYAFSERFVLPLSHDEVVHGKRSLLSKMPGDEWRRRANLRALLALMWTHPGKKLLFMGGEFGQLREWDHDTQLDWELIDDPAHAGLLALVRDLNIFYVGDPALHQGDAHPDGFRWLVVDDRENSVFAFLRTAIGAQPLMVIVNMTPTPRTEYRIGAPYAGRWREVLNSDAPIYGGSGMIAVGDVQTEPVACHGALQSLSLSIPPLAAIVLRHTDA